jgi:hypothetical protein
MSRYLSVKMCFEDEIVGQAVAEILELLDYMDQIDSIDMTPPPPPPLIRQQAVEIVDLTGDDDEYDDLPVASRLDFTLVVDELDNGGLFGSA